MSTATAPSRSTDAPPLCHRHPQPATYRCDSCGTAFCEACLRENRAERAHFQVCPRCHNYCRNIAASGPPQPSSVGEILRDAFAYPLRESGLAMMLFGGAFFALIGLLSMSWRFGRFFAVFGGGYLSAYLFRVLNSSALGDRKLPGWPEFTNIWDSVVVPFRQMMLPSAVCMGPAIVPLVAFGLNPGSAAASILIALAGSLYLPMALLAVGLNESLAAMQPSVVLPAIRAVPGPYLVTWALLALTGGLCSLLHALVFEALPILGLGLSAVIALYLLTVEMRFLGLFYYAHSDRLGLV